MAFTLANLKTSIQARGYGTDTAAQQLEFVQTILRRVYSERRWRFLQKTNQTVTIAVGATTASLVAITDRQAGKLEGVRLVPGTGDVVELEELEWEDLRARDAADPANGEPAFYARQDNDTIQFWPRADKSYTLRVDYISLPTLPAVDGDAVVFPDEHRDVLADGAAAMLAGRQRDWNARNAYQQDYLDGYVKFASAQQIRGAQSPARMAHWDGWDIVAR